jgi:hypothetical protein
LVFEIPGNSPRIGDIIQDIINVNIEKRGGERASLSHTPSCIE